MDFITKNPGLQHIIEETFMNLDHENLLKCQQVNLSWRIILKNPIFCLKKCVQNGLSNEDQLEWYKFIQTLKNKDLNTGNVTTHLIELHECLEWHFKVYPGPGHGCRSTITRNYLCYACGMQKIDFSVSTFLKKFSNPCCNKHHLEGKKLSFCLHRVLFSS